MKDSTEAGWLPVVFDEGEAIFPGVVAVVGGAAVDDDWEMGGEGECHLPDKHVLLNVARGVAVVVVEADFSPGDYFGSAGKGFELAEVGVGGEFRFVRMDADGGVDEIILGGEFDGAVEGAGAISGADGEDGSDAGLTGTGEDFVAVGVEAGAVEVGVGVDEHETES